MKTNQYRPTAEQEKAALEFSIKNHCIISPDGWGRQLEGYLEHGHCVCSPERKTCPCTEASQELKEKGRCLCGLFWSGYQAYAIAKHFEKNLDQVAIGVEAKPDRGSVDQSRIDKEDAPKPHRLKKFEALLNFREGFEEPAPPSHDYIAEAVSLLTDKAGISLDECRRITIFKDEEGVTCVDIAPPQELPDIAKKDSKDEGDSSNSSAASAPPIIPSEDIEIRLLKELHKALGFERSSELILLAMDEFYQIITPEEKERKNDDGSLYWPSEFRRHLKQLVRLGDATEFGLSSCHITDQGLARIGATKPKPRG